MKLVTKLDTYFKTSSADSSKLGDNDRALVEAGKEFPVIAYRQEAGHIVITIPPNEYDLKSLHPSGRNTWWVFEGAIEDPEGFSADNVPKDKPAPKPDIKNLGFQFLLPGNTVKSWSGQAVHDRKAPNITWGELLHFQSNGSYRPPENAAIVANLIEVAIRAQEIRDRFGGPLIIRSGYRDPATNQRVGGARFSTHVQGKAIDLAIPGRRPLELYNALNSSWNGGLAYSNRMDFLHIDTRSGRARWVYPGG